MTALKSPSVLKATGIEARCAATGMRMTEQRRVIARVLAEALDHPDVEELYRRCVAVDDKISISTVYRTVKLFEDAGIIERHDFREGRARYEQMRDSHHDHLINQSPASSATSWSITGWNCIASRWTTTNPDRRTLASIAVIPGHASSRGPGISRFRARCFASLRNDGKDWISPALGYN